jgi:hypothetical protein
VPLDNLFASGSRSPSSARSLNQGSPLVWLSAVKHSDESLLVQHAPAYAPDGHMIRKNTSLNNSSGHGRDGGGTSKLIHDMILVYSTQRDVVHGLISSYCNVEDISNVPETYEILRESLFLYVVHKCAITQYKHKRVNGEIQ